MFWMNRTGKWKYYLLGASVLTLIVLYQIFVLSGYVEALSTFTASARASADELFVQQAQEEAALYTAAEEPEEATAEDDSPTVEPDSDSLEQDSISEEPDDVVEMAFTALNELNYEMFSSLVLKEEDAFVNQFQMTYYESMILANLVEYTEVLPVKTLLSDDEAIVRCQITAIDMRLVYEKYLDHYLNGDYVDYYSEFGPSDYEKYCLIINDLIYNETSMVVRYVDFTLYDDGFGWYIVLDDAAEDSILGGYYSEYEKMVNDYEVYDFYYNHTEDNLGPGGQPDSKADPIDIV